MEDQVRDKNHFDERPLAYYERVRDGFREFAEHHRTYFVDAMESREEMHKVTVGILREHGIE